MSIILQTERLLLRPPQAADISRIVPLLGDFEVSRNLARTPHPYTEDDGCAFVVRAADLRERGVRYVFVVLRKCDAVLVGACGVENREPHEFGYWLGRAYWGQGLATEAARAVVAFAFDTLKLERLEAGWFCDNPASGRVLQKLGCTEDGGGERSCLSRGHAVFCHKVVLTRTAFRR